MKVVGLSRKSHKKSRKTQVSLRNPPVILFFCFKKNATKMPFKSAKTKKSVKCHTTVRCFFKKNATKMRFKSAKQKNQSNVTRRYGAFKKRGIQRFRTQCGSARSAVPLCSVSYPRLWRGVVVVFPGDKK